MGGGGQSPETVCQATMYNALTKTALTVSSLSWFYSATV